MTREIDPREREFFASMVEDAGGKPLPVIARTLRIWASVQPGGSYADQCRIMAEALDRAADNSEPAP